MDQCATQAPVFVDIKAVNRSIANTVYFSMKLNVQEEVNGPLEMMLVVKQCDFKMKSCEHYQNISINEMCQKLKDPNSLYSKALAEIKPPLTCPFKVGNYSMMESSIDFSMLTDLPIEGHIYVVDVKWISGQKTVLCLENETKITKSFAEQIEVILI